MVTRKPPPNDTQLDLFSAVLTDIATRDTQDTMEVPFLSLSKKPRFTPLSYKSDTTEITVSGGAPFGIATIWDWDLIMWLLSQVRESLDQGKNVSRKIRFHPHSFLKAARRSCGGVQYQRLDDAVKRLKNTTVVTTLRAKRGRTVMFSWLEYGELERDEQGRIQYATVVLPEWLFEAVSDNRLVLSLHPDYFLLTGGIERWLYRFIRKQAGSNRAGWGWYFQTLYERSGSTQRFSDFAIALREIAGKRTLLDYTLTLQERDEREYLHAKRSTAVGAQREPEVVLDAPTPQFLHLRTSTYEKAKELVPGYDVYALEAEWKEATKRNGVLVNNPDSAFLGWCRKVGARPLIASRK